LNRWGASKADLFSFLLCLDSVFFDQLRRFTDMGQGRTQASFGKAPMGAAVEVKESNSQMPVAQ
jgi:hypothetical protein